MSQHQIPNSSGAPGDGVASSCPGSKHNTQEDPYSKVEGKMKDESAVHTNMSQEMQIRDMEKVLECFSGDKGAKRSWPAYLQLFNRHAESRGMDDRSKAKVLVRKLRDNAETDVEDLTSEQLLQFDTLVAALSAYFNPEQRRDVCLDALNERHQGAGESPADFAEAVRRLAMDAYPGEGESVRRERNAAALTAFKRGLPSGMLKVYVLDETWLSLTKAGEGETVEGE